MGLLEKGEMTVPCPLDVGEPGRSRVWAPRQGKGLGQQWRPRRLARARAQPPAFPRNPRGRLGFPGPTQGEG